MTDAERIVRKGKTDSTGVDDRFGADGIFWVGDEVPKGTCLPNRHEFKPLKGLTIFCVRCGVKR